MTNREYLSNAIKPPVPWIELAEDTEYAIWRDENVVYCSFQGSLSSTDWLYNLMAWTIGGAHYGIYKKFKIVKPVLDKILAEGKAMRFCFLGHSQGAGVALLSYLYAREKGLVAIAKLFGCPKILNLWRYFKERKYETGVEQFIVNTDIVTHLSPVLIQIGKHTRLGPKKPIWKWKISDHCPSTYKRYIED